MTVARAVFRGQDGSLEKQIERLVPEPALPPAWRPRSRADERSIAPPAAKLGPPPELSFNNGYGGFTADGHEYVINIPGDTAPDRLPPAPWTNCLGNAVAGCLTTDGGLGTSWTGNSQTNRITPWSNDPVLDPAAEIVYIRDEASGEFWTPTPRPLGQGVASRVRHGQGYTVYEQVRADIALEMRVFVPPDDPVKLITLKLTNQSKRPRRLTVWYYAESDSRWTPRKVGDEHRARDRCEQRCNFRSQLLPVRFCQSGRICRCLATAANRDSRSRRVLWSEPVPVSAGRTGT